MPQGQRRVNTQKSAAGLLRITVPRVYARAIIETMREAAAMGNRSGNT